MSIHYGTKHRSDLSGTQITAAIRADLKAAVAAGELPKAKFSVRLERYAGGKSITITAAAFDFDLFDPRYLRHEIETKGHEFYPARQRYSLEWQAMRDTLTKIGNAYNFDGSDIQTDYFYVNYYLHVDIDRDFEAKRRQIETDQVRAQLAAEAATARAKQQRADLERELTPEENPVMLSMQRRQADSTTRRLGLAPLLLGAAAVALGMHLTRPYWRPRLRALR